MRAARISAPLCLMLVITTACNDPAFHEFCDLHQVRNDADYERCVRDASYREHIVRKEIESELTLTTAYFESIENGLLAKALTDTIRQQAIRVKSVDDLHIRALFYKGPDPVEHSDMLHQYFAVEAVITLWYQHGIGIADIDKEFGPWTTTVSGQTLLPDQLTALGGICALTRCRGDIYLQLLPRTTGDAFGPDSEYFIIGIDNFVLPSLPDLETLVEKRYHEIWPSPARPN